MAERGPGNEWRRLVSAELARWCHLRTGDGAVQTGRSDIHTALAVAVVLATLQTTCTMGALILSK